MKGLEKILGLDLAGSEKRPTGYAYFHGEKLKVGVLYKDTEILELAEGFSLIMMDAPLSLPEGRKSIEEMGPHFRECDLMLRRLGHKFFPISLGPMRKLTERGMRLARMLRQKGKHVLETFPGAFYDRRGVRRKDKKVLLELYRSLGLRLEDREYLQDELDAIACLLSGMAYMEGRALLLEGKDGLIVVG